MPPIAIVTTDQPVTAVVYRGVGRRVVESGANRYQFFIDSNADLAYVKSTNRGRTWGAPIVIHAAAYEKFAIWFDQWTPGDSGVTVHIWAIDSTADDVNYFSLNTSTDTLGNAGTPIVVFDGASVLTTSGNMEISGAKARGGNLSVAFDIDGGTETGFYRSIDGGATWGARANPNEATSDYYLLFPGNDADNQDMYLAFWDRSANEVSLKVYDDSADSWGETSISTGMSDQSTATIGQQFAGTVRLSDGHLLLAAWNDRDTVTSRLQTWDINGAASITAKGDIHTNIDDCQGIVLTLGPTETVFATYIGKGDGSETVNSAVKIYRKSSVDGMANWGTEYEVFSDNLINCAWIGGPLQSESVWPCCVWLVDAFAGSQDIIEGAWLTVSPHPQAAIGL